MIPSDIASFVFCHEAQDHVGSIGTAVSQLLGKYGGPASQVQATPASRPTIQVTVVDALPCLRFDNTDDEILLDASTLLAGPYTIFCVYAGRGANNDGQGHNVMHGDPAYNGGWGAGWRMQWQGNAGGLYQANAYPGGGNEINSFTYVQDAVDVHMTQMGAPFSTGFKYRKNNVLVGSASDATGPGILRIGSSVGSPAHADWLASIGFNAELSNTDRDGMYNYITNDILGGGQQLFTQFNAELVASGSSAFHVSQFCIEYIRAVGNPFYHTQVSG